MSTKKIRTIIIVISILMTSLTACNKLDNAINSGIDSAFGNTTQCSGIVC